MKFLASLAVSLSATGRAAVLIAWAVCIAALGIFGSGDLAKSALGVLSTMGAILVVAFGFYGSDNQRTR